MPRRKDAFDERQVDPGALERCLGHAADRERLFGGGEVRRARPAGRVGEEEEAVERDWDGY